MDSWLIFQQAVLVCVFCNLSVLCGKMLCVCVELLKIFDTEDDDNTEAGKTLRAKADMLEQQLAVAGCYAVWTAWSRLPG